MAVRQTGTEGEAGGSEKGEKERLVELAARNAALVLSQDKERIKKEELRTIGAINQIGELIESGASGAWRRTISLIPAAWSPWVLWWFMRTAGQKRSDYRKFRIKTVQGPNDYASMEEVLTRRFFLHGMRETEELKERAPI